MTPAERIVRLEQLALERDPARRRLQALGIVADRLREDDLEPILVGGGALEFYTEGGYATGDLDLALAHGPDVDAAFSELGFRKVGRFFIREDLDLLFDPCAPAGLPGETAPRTEVSIAGMKIVILGLEDLLMDRLRAWVHWRSDEDGRWTKRLAALYADRLDWAYLRQHAEAIPEERVALARIEEEVSLNDSGDSQR